MTLRAGLLDGRRVAIAGGPDGAIAARLTELGATVDAIGPATLADEEGAAAWARERAPLAAAVVCTAAAFGPGGPLQLAGALELSWRAARAFAAGAPSGSPQPGRLMLVAPGPDAGPHAPAARAGLENLARTLSVEWARFAVTAVAIAPGPGTDDAEVAELIAYLASDAGGYFSGCRFDLGLIPSS
jgi:hypothetical protein